MKTDFFRILAAGVFMLCITCQAATDPAISAKEKVWSLYLGDDECSSLSGMMAQMKKESQERHRDGQPAPGSPAEAIANARKQFNSYTAEWAPPLPGIATEKHDADGIKGVWFLSGKAGDDRVILYLHGGGFIVGSPQTAASITGGLVKESGIKCFSLDYPLAPESPFPAALDNAVAAYRMLLGKGYKPGHIILAGDSAGGGLVLSTLLKLRDQHLPMPAGAYLISPWTDLSLSFPTHQNKAGVDNVIHRDFLMMMLSPYIGGNDPKNPFISPAFAGLNDLCPLLIHAGSHEILLDDSLTIARNAALADVPVEIKVWPGYGHDFPMYHAKLGGGRKALEDAARFFKEVTARQFLLAPARQ